MTRSRTPAVACLLLMLAAVTSCSPRGGGLELVPARPACKIPKVVAVHWHLSAEEPLPASLMVNSPGRPMKFWRRVSTHVGEADTGAWASDGLTVTLVSKDGQPLARRTLTRGPCEEG